MRNCTFACSFIGVCNLVSEFEGRTKAVGVAESGAEEGDWTDLHYYYSGTSNYGHCN
jgi:hypothetical protein